MSERWWSPSVADLIASGLVVAAGLLILSGVALAFQVTEQGADVKSWLDFASMFATPTVAALLLGAAVIETATAASENDSGGVLGLRVLQTTAVASILTIAAAGWTCGEFSRSRRKPVALL